MISNCRFLRSASAALGLTLVAASVAFGTELRVDGELSVIKPFGQTIRISVKGTPGQQAYLLSDFEDGPSTLYGRDIPVGLSAAVGFDSLGTIPASGELHVGFSLAMKFRDLDLRPIYLVAFVGNLAQPQALDWSNGASFVLSDREFADIELAGERTGDYPFFDYQRAFNEGEPLDIAIDPNLLPFVVGKIGKVYITAKKSKSQWLADPSLIDVTSDGPNPISLKTFKKDWHLFEIDSGTISGTSGIAVGVGRDIVVDLNSNGILDQGDLIDGYSDEAGFYTVRDVTKPGPYPVTEMLYSGGTFLGQNTYFPSNIVALGELPLVILSHGNGHNYQWYDYIGYHLASYGFIVMSHENNTQAGIEAAATTTLSNVEYLLGNLTTIGGGALKGHVDKHRMMWIGHSRGGEGIVRAYDRIVDGKYFPKNFQFDDIQLLSSMAPTDFLGTNSANPHAANYALLVGGADGDVTGCANVENIQSFHLLGRAQGAKQSISMHGVGHGDFHDSTGSVALGPCLVGKPDAHTLILGYLLPLARHYLADDIPAKDFLWRQFERFRPLGAPVTNSCVVVDLQYRPHPNSGTRVIDDFQTNESDLLASSGAAINATVQELAEGRLDDATSVFTNDLSDVFNGSTQCSATDSDRGAVFEWNGQDFKISYKIPSEQRDWRGFKFLSLRAAQATRHPLTATELADLVFDVAIVDGDAGSSRASIGAFGGGIEEPYQRAGCGIGSGWGNEFETIRIRLADLQAGDKEIDFSNITRMELRFGVKYGTALGRILLDDIQLEKD